MASLLLFSACSGFAQQRPMFTQYMFNGLVINPAYASVDEALSVTAVHRQQWTGFNGAPNTQTLSAHSPICESNTAVGLLLSRDQIGISLVDQAALMSVSQRVRVGYDTWLAVALSAGFSQYRSDYGNSTDQISSVDPMFQNESNLNLNLGAGMMLFSNTFYAGLSVPTFTAKRITTISSQPTTERPHAFFYGGVLLDPEGFVKAKPNLLLKYVPGSPLQADVNMNVLFADIFWVGASWRSFDSIDLMTQIQVMRNLQVGYSYDFTPTALGSAQRGSHEIMLRLRVPVKGRGFPRCFF